MLQAPPIASTRSSMAVRAFQLGESLDLKGFEHAGSFSLNPPAFRTDSGGTAVLLRSGAVVLFGIDEAEETSLIRGLGNRIVAPLALREIETVQIVVRPGEEELVGPQGALQLRSFDPVRLLLVAEALAVSVSLAYNERRVGATFDRIEPVATDLARGRLPKAPQPDLLQQIGEALLIQKHLAARADLDDKPDVLWDHPSLDRFWAKLVDEYDLAARARALERKLAAIQETSETLRDLITTRTSHRLEWYVIALIAIEIALSLWDRLFLALR